MGNSIQPIDVDGPGTWPPGVVEWATREAERLRGSTQHTSDLAVSIEHEDDFRALLTRPLLAYHCTRLLDEEVEAIRHDGLRMLSRGLVRDRIASARRSGQLDELAASRLVAGNVYALNAEDGREGQVCFVLGRSIFDEPNNGAIPLLEAWGGEAVNGGPQDALTNPVLGRPSIVVAAINLSVGWQVSPTFPALNKMFVATLLGLGGRTADVFFRAPIPSSMILDVWQPGHVEYERHRPLVGI